MHKKILKRITKFVKFRVLHLDDSPHRIALGIALGVFVAYTPPLGHHIILVLLLSFIFRANKAAAMTWIWLSNPLTYILLYYPNYLVGRAVLLWNRTSEQMDPQQVGSMLKHLMSFEQIMTGFYTTQFWKDMGHLIMQIGTELLVGGLILGGIVAPLVYIFFYKLIVWYRKKHPHHFPDFE